MVYLRVIPRYKPKRRARLKGLRLEDKLEIILPVDLLEKIDRIVDLLGFGSREEFVVAAVRRAVDQYMLLVTVE